ncbi:MAG: M23 family metallopeptidase [Tannerellaceae bacterium]|nr:M23 family metallopeptidase [Tannerellaceae bacterium]
MRFKKLYNLLLCVSTLVAFSTCHTIQTTTQTNSWKPAAQVVFPEITFEIPQLELNAFESVAILDDSEFMDVTRVDITDVFTASDMQDVTVRDPKLFAWDNELLIDLTQIREDAYSFPLRGAKLISDYKGNRKNHTGVDLKTFAKDTIVSAFDGVVRMSKPYAAYGNVIVVRHYNGLETLYSHNAKNLVKPGERVTAGQPIALVGRTGRATTDHLHFEVRVNGHHFDPKLLFDMNSQELQDKSLLCVKSGNSIKVNLVDPFPYQASYLKPQETV